MDTNPGTVFSPPAFTRPKLNNKNAFFSSGDPPTPGTRPDMSDIRHMGNRHKAHGCT